MSALDESQPERPVESEAAEVASVEASEPEPIAQPVETPDPGSAENPIAVTVEPEPEPDPIPEPEPEPEPEVVVEPEPAPDPPAVEEPVLEDAHLGVSPFTRATALAHAEAIASQQSQVRGGASAPLGNDQLNSLRVEFLDQWDSRWQRDPGRANGPFT